MRSCRGEREFTRPADVLQSSDLNHDEKVATLQQWALDVRLKRVAEDENMTAPAQEQAGPSLTEIAEALRELGAELVLE